MTNYKSFVPEMPYCEKFNTARLYQHVKNKRTYVAFYNTGDRSSVEAGGGCLYSRYLYQVQYWKDYGDWIPDGYHVDHINDNPFDDRLENLQLLTPQENIRKRDEASYAKRPISEEDIIYIRSLLQDGRSYAFISEKLMVSHGHIRYLVRTRFPEFATTDKIVELNRDSIRSMVEKGMPQTAIADEFDVSQITISRFIRDNLPECHRDTIMGKRLEIVEDGLIKGETNVQIAKRLGRSDASVCLYIKRFFPRYAEERIVSDEQDRIETLKKVKMLLESGHTQLEISQLLEISPWTVSNLVVKYLPEFTNENTYKERVKQVGKLLRSGISRETIARSLAIRPGVVSTIISRFYPDYGFGVKRTTMLDKLKELVLADEVYPLSRTAKILGISEKTVSDYMFTYFPDKTQKGKINELRDRIKEFLASTEETLTQKQVAQRLGVDYMRVKSVFRNGLESSTWTVSDEKIAELKKLLDDNIKFSEIGEKLGITNLCRLARLVKHHFPDIYEVRTRKPSVL